MLLASKACPPLLTQNQLLICYESRFGSKLVTFLFKLSPNWANSSIIWVKLSQIWAKTVLFGSDLKQAKWHEAARLFDVLEDIAIVRDIVGNWNSNDSVVSEIAVADAYVGTKKQQEDHYAVLGYDDSPNLEDILDGLPYTVCYFSHV